MKRASTIGTGIYDYVANKVGELDAWAQIVSQLWAVGTALVWSAFVILFILKKTTGRGPGPRRPGEKAYGH